MLMKHGGYNDQKVDAGRARMRGNRQSGRSALAVHPVGHDARPSD